MNLYYICFSVDCLLRLYEQKKLFICFYKKEFIQLHTKLNFKNKYYDTRNAQTSIRGRFTTTDP